MTVVQPNSISGITSLTCTSDTLSIHDSDGNLVRNITSSGIVTCTKLEVSPGTGATFFENGNVVIAGILTVPTIGNGMIITDNELNGDHYIGTAFNGLMAGPVTVNGYITVDGNWAVV